MTTALEFNIDAAQRELDQRSAQGEDVSHLRVDSKGRIVPVAAKRGYPCTDCIIDLIASSGPQDIADLRRECKTQAVPFTPDLFTLAVGELMSAGKLVLEPNDGDAYFDFPESYYNAQIS